MSIREGASVGITWNWRWALVGCLALACGGSGTGPMKGSGGGMSGAAAGGAATSGTGGGAGQAGSAGTVMSGNSAGSGGSLVLGDSPGEACIAYALAACSRGAECDGRGASYCVQASFGCPDLVFSPGATRTPAGLKACAIEYATFSCDELHLGKLPACVTPGTRQTGEACVFSSECESRSCKRSGSCGVCARVVGEGQDCSAPDVDCEFHLNCDGGVCTAMPVPQPSGTLEVGQPCGAAAACRADLYCASSTGLCAPYPTLGMSCADRRSCVSDSYCELNGLVCAAPPSAGQPCGVDGYTGQAVHCAEDLYCQRTSESTGTCGLALEVGEPCLVDPETQLPTAYGCGDNRRCDTSVMPAVCAELLGPGADCTNPPNDACSQGLSCLCDPVAPNQTCPKRTCATLRFAGQRCDEPGALCHPAFTCTGGVCVPLDSQGTFASSCPAAQ
jgi:hypothetical protein